MTKPPVIQAEANAEAIALATGLLAAKHAALSYIDAETGTPGISRIAFGLGPDGAAMTLISALAPHTAALRANPACAILLGEPGAKGDPLTHPRLMLRATATFVEPDSPDRAQLRAHWLKGHPKAALYIDFADFALVRFAVGSALLNGGFGKAWHVAPADLGLAS
jgi:heme iron utilization protein